MITKINKLIVKNNEDSSRKLILESLNQKKIILITNKFEKINNSLDEINYEKSAIIIKSSGSKNRPKFCLHTISNLNNSAISSGNWLEEQGFILKNCLIFNTLPFYHISGVMPLWRSKIWDCSYERVAPNLIKNTKDLYENTIRNELINKKHLITSLVPSQLNRLIEEKYGLEWLKLFDLVWVGGAALSTETITKCIKEKINLSPCYGATETAAMITALKPSEFLNGNSTSGELLKDIKLNINNYGLIKVKSNRIGFKIRDKELKSFTDKSGWWESGDLGKKIRIKNKIYIKIIGRGDNAFSSGGEIIFPDIIIERLKKFTVANKLPFEKFIISKLEDKYRENKFKIIIQLKNNAEKNKIQSSLDLLKEYTEIWSKHERPLKWVVISEKIQTENYIENWKNIQI